MGIGTIRDRTIRKVSCVLAAFALVFSSLIPSQAIAWGGYGHRTTGEIALANVKPETRRALARLLKY